MVSRSACCKFFSDILSSSKERLKQDFIKIVGKGGSDAVIWASNTRNYFSEEARQFFPLLDHHRLHSQIDAACVKM